jgi:hypothetical protein
MLVERFKTAWWRTASAAAAGTRYDICVPSMMADA